MRKRKRPIRVLDIGCGEGFDLNQAYQWILKSHADEYWGLEPDEHVTPPAGLFDRHFEALMETADLPPNAFDVAYSYQVMEHVAEPQAFMSAVHRCLKPGGVYLFITPNRRHYFARVASTLNSLKLADAVLHLVRGEQAEHYHHPLQYRFNDERSIAETCSQLGFEPPEFTYLEEDGPRVYFPTPFRPIFHALVFSGKVIRNPRSLLDFLCRITKKP
jgi:SAM-dependent methyltransferase